MMKVTIDGDKIIVDEQTGWLVTRTVFDTSKKEIINVLYELGWRQDEFDYPDDGWCD